MKLSTLLFILFSGITFSNVSLAAQTPSEPTQKQQQVSQAQQPQQTQPAEKQVVQVNINTASAEELAKVLNGIGANKAQKIVEYREKFGPFVSVEQLKEVSGIGQSTLDKNVGKIAL